MWNECLVVLKNYDKTEVHFLSLFSKNKKMLNLFSYGDSDGEEENNEKQ